MSEFEPYQSRSEAILQNMLGANNELEPPQSREEALLQQILDKGGGSPLPPVTSSDNGKVLGVDNGQWGATENLPVISYNESTYYCTFTEAQAAYMKSGKPFVVRGSICIFNPNFSTNYPAVIMSNSRTGVVYSGWFHFYSNTIGYFYANDSQIISRLEDLGIITVPYYCIDSNEQATDSNGNRYFNCYIGTDSFAKIGFHDARAFHLFTIDDPTFEAQLAAILTAMKQMAVSASDGTYVGYVPLDCSAFIAAAEQTIKKSKGIYNVFGNAVQVVSGYTLDGLGNINSIQYTGMDYDASGTDPIVYTIETTLTPTMLIGKIIAKTATAFPIS